MAEEVIEEGYGYESDEVKVSPFNFGLNAGKTFLKKFEWTPTGGKDGAEQEALDIVFSINDTEKGYRLFPVTKAFLKDNRGETTDRNTVEFKSAVKEFEAKVFHIIHCFVETDTYKIALSRRIASFKDFCNVVAALLPKNFATKPLDSFMQFQWQMGDGKSRTYLELPRKMSYGKWIAPAQAGTWIKVEIEGADDSEREALRYGKKETAVLNKDGKIEKYTEFHPFIRNGWFMKSNFAKQQSDDTASESTPGTGSNVESTSTATAQNTAPATVESW